MPTLPDVPRHGYRHAKASDEERAAVRHHLLDVIEPSETMSVARFQQMARETIADLKSRGIRPILVGGSGLYARAAIDDISFPGTDPQIREHLEERERTEGATALFRELAVKDPQAAEHMDPRNPPSHHSRTRSDRGDRQTVFGHVAPVPLCDSVGAIGARP